MAEPFVMRLRRILHSLTEESAIRMARFLISDLRARSEIVPEMAELPISGGYSEDLPRLNAMPSDALPPVIFQTWKSKSVVPSNYRYWRQTFVDHNPDFTVLLWDDHDNRAFIADRFPWALPLYDSYPREIFRADAVRFFFLLEFGGMYSDMDTECLRPILPSAASGEVVLCRMGGDPTFPHSIPNAIMASHSGQIFWLFAISKLFEAAARIPDAESRAAAGPEALTGPVLLKNTYDAFMALDEEGVRQAVASFVEKLDARQRARLRYSRPVLLPSNAWYPVDWTNLIQKQLSNRLRKDKRILPQHVAAKLFPHSAVVTYWSHSW